MPCVCPSSTAAPISLLLMPRSNDSRSGNSNSAYCLRSGFPAGLPKIRPALKVTPGTCLHNSPWRAYQSGSGARSHRTTALNIGLLPSRMSEPNGMESRVGLVVTVVSRQAKVWIALWTVYIVWGSTYLGIELAGETMPPFFAAGTRFLIAGLLMLGIVAWRRGAGALRLTRAEAATSLLIGILLPGPNSLLFLAERQVPIGLTSLIIASIPLWVLLLRFAARERPDLVSVAGLLLGFVGIAVLVQPGGGSGSLGYLLLTVLAALMWAIGSFLSPRMPVPRDAFAATAYEM